MTSSPLTPGHGRVPSLDGLRALSILLVLIGHARHTVDFDSGYVSDLLTLLGNQTLGVSIFFVISGFLITGILFREIERYGSINLQRFYIRRAFRILPAYYFFLTVMGVIAWSGIVNLHWRQELGAALFTTNYRPEGSWWIGHSWSLCVEEHFYLFWPLSLALLGARRCYWLAIGVILFSPAARVASYYLFPNWRGAINVMSHTRADQLMLGCVAALLYGSTRFQTTLDKLFRYKAHWSAALFIFCISPLLERRFRGAYMLPAGFSLEGFGILVVLLWVVRHPQGRPGKILNSRPAIALGILSYSLYLWQQPFLTPLNQTFSGSFPWNMLCAFTLATFSYIVVERTFLRWRGRMGDRAGPRMVDACATSGTPAVALQVPVKEDAPSLAG